MDESFAGRPELAAVIGRRLRDVRRARGWSQQALAEGLFSKGYVSSIEHGKIFPSVRALQALAGRLGVDMSEFFDPDMLGEVAPAALDGAASDARRNRLRLQEVRTLAAIGDPDVFQRARLVDPAPLSALERVDLHYALAQAHLAAGAPASAIEALEQALQALATVPETAQTRMVAARVQVLVGETLLARGPAGLAVEQFDHVRQNVWLDPIVRLSALTGLARAYAAQGDSARARAAFGDALSLAQETQSIAKLAQQWIGLSRQAAADQQWDEAEQFGEEAYLLSQRARTLEVVLRTYLDYGILLRPAYNSSARGLLESAVQLAGQLGSAALVAQAGAELAVAEIEAGQPEAARLALDRAAAAAPPDDLRARAHVVYAEARIAQAAGNLDRAEAELRTAIRLLEGVGDPVVLAESYVALARLLVAQGRPDDAAPLYERAFATRGAVPVAHELPSG